MSENPVPPTEPSPQATAPRVALVTCAALPDLDPDDAPLVPALAARGVDADVVVWDDVTVDWSAYDLAVIRSTWDYSPRRDAFLAWAGSVPHLLNTAATVEWNSDKVYLQQMAEQGVPTIPTVWLDPERNLSARAVHTRMPAAGDFVIKPTVSAGARDTARYEAGDAKERGLAIRHTVDLLRTGRPAMIQPYLTDVDTQGEGSLVYIDGTLSHGVRKSAMLTGPEHGEGPRLVAEDVLSAEYQPTEAEIAVGRAVLAAYAALLPDAGTPLYARVDLVPGPEGPVLIELELIEPSLFLGLHEGAHDALADAIVARLDAAS